MQILDGMLDHLGIFKMEQTVINVLRLVLHDRVQIILIELNVVIHLLLLTILENVCET